MLPRPLCHFQKVSSRALTDPSTLSGPRLALQGFPKDLLREAARHLGLLSSHPKEEKEEEEKDEDEAEEEAEEEENILKDNHRWIVLCYLNESCPEDCKGYLETLVQKQAVRVIHWVEYISGQSADDVCMVWRESYGTSDSMKHLVEPISRECSTEDPCCVHPPIASLDGLQRILLVGEAGHGKTMYIKSLAIELKKNSPRQWVVPVKIIEHRELLCKWNDVKDLMLDHVVELVVTAAGIETAAERRCLEAALCHKEVVTVLVDGVDEIWHAFKGLALRLLALLCQLPLRCLWVTSRPQVEPCLRRVMRSVPMTLQALNYGQQQQFLSSQLKSMSPEHILNHVAPWMGGMLGNPLWLRMAAKVIETTPVFVKKKTASLFDLYEEFVKRKYEEYEEKYFLPPHMTNHFNDKYEKYAIIYLFADQDNLKKLILKKFANFVMQDNLSPIDEKIGIVWKESKMLTFAHHTFAEYFASKWLFAKAHSCRKVRNFLYELVNKDKCKKTLLQKFLEDQLAKEWPFHAAAMRRDMQEVQRVMMRGGWDTGLWEERDILLQRTFGEHVCWAYQETIQLSPEEEAFRGRWLVLAFRAAVDSSCHCVVAEVLHRANLELPAWTLKEALRAAVTRGDLEVARVLLERGVRASHYSRHDSLLHVAAQKGSFLMVDLLVSYERDVNLRDVFRRTPLHLAIGLVKAHHQHEAAQRLIKEQSVDVEAEEMNKWTPLGCASAADCVLCAESLLLHRGAKVNGGTFSPLLAAASNNNTNIIRLLLEKGASLNATDSGGNTPLHLAVKNGRMEAMLLLVLKGADIRLGNSEGKSALDIARQDQKEDIAEVLENYASSEATMDKELLLARLQLMIDLKAAAMRGSHEEVREISQQLNFVPCELRGALLTAAEGESKGHTEVTRILLQLRGEKVENPGALTPLHYAAHGGNVDTVELLLSYYPDVSVRDFKGRTPLHLAIGWRPNEHRHEATQRLLKEESADLEAEDTDGCTPLCCASLVDCVSCVESLLLRGAKIDSGSYPPLFAAANSNNTNTMRVLLRNGAQVNATNKDGATALHFAVVAGHKGAVLLLLLMDANKGILDRTGVTPSIMSVRHTELRRILRGKKKRGNSTNRWHWCCGRK